MGIQTLGEEEFQLSKQDISHSQGSIGWPGVISYIPCDLEHVY